MQTIPSTATAETITGTNGGTRLSATFNQFARFQAATTVFGDSLEEYVSEKPL
jgi:hypothetical protein